MSFNPQPDEIARPAQRHARRPHGITAIELMVVVAIAAILLSIAAPSLVGVIQSNRVASEMNAFVGDLQLARAEAIKQGQPVTLCVSDNGQRCVAATSWHQGWIVFSDPDSNKTVNDNNLEPVLKRQLAWTSSDTFTGNFSAVTFSRDGFALGLADGGALTLKTQPDNAAATRCVTIQLSGHQQVNAGSACP